MGYVKLPDEVDFSTTFDTYIIGYCADTDEFFITNQRFFFWETEETFESEESALQFLESHLDYLVSVRNKLLSEFIYSDRNDNYLWLQTKDGRKKYELK